MLGENIERKNIIVLSFIRNWKPSEETVMLDGNGRN
jgi:hypothetical protein